MKYSFAILALLGCLHATAARAAGDVLHLKDGTVVRCEIVAITDNVLTYKTTVDLGGGRSGSAQPTISPKAVDYIEFGPVPGEREILAKPKSASLDALKSLWDEKSRHLHRPRSNAGEIGRLYGNRLLDEPEEFHWNAALAVFDRILERDWNRADRAETVKGRLRGMIRLGRLDQAEAEARDLAGETGDPEMLIEARYALAQGDFSKLRQLQEEHPKWQEDDSVRPERERLYHAAIDRFLRPYLFHGTEESLAARGLLAAAETHRFAGREDEARACLGDVLALYADTAHAPQARAALAAMNQAKQTESDPTNDDDSQSKYDAK